MISSAKPNACCDCGRLSQARDLNERIWKHWVRCCTSGIFWTTTGALPKPCGGASRRIHSIPLLAEEGWRDSLIETDAPGAKREPDRAKPQSTVSSAEIFRHSDHPVCAFGASTPPLRGGELFFI